MIDNFLLLLTIIVIFSISILIYIILNNKEGFENIDDTKDIKEARLKLNLESDLINYQKGPRGVDGKKGARGPTPLRVHGPPGKKGEDGENGNHWGDIKFKNNKGEIIDQLLNPENAENKNDPCEIIVPNPKKGKTGEVGTILFVNHKKEIIGSYYPPDGSYAKTLKPIVINVPQGIKGEPGEDGEDDQHPKGPTGEVGQKGPIGNEGQRGSIGESGEKGLEGGGKDDETYKNVKVDNKICFKGDQNACINFELLKAFVNYDDYLKKLEERRLRLIKELCYLEFYEDYNKEEHPERDRVINFKKGELEKIYTFNNETFNYNEIINKENGNCPKFPEKPSCTFNENHFHADNQFLQENCSCEQLTTDCGVGKFVSRKAYIGKDHKDRDVYISDNKCAPCTLTRDHIDEEKGEVYVGCDGKYDGIAASCEPNEYIEITPGPNGYVCKDCGTCTNNTYKAGGCIGTLPNDCKSCTNCSPSQYETSACTHGNNRTCENCLTSCPAGQYLSGSCGGNGTGNNSCNSCPAGYYCTGDRNIHQCPAGQISGAGAGSCTACPCGQESNQNRTQCNWKTDGYYQFYDFDGKGNCSKINDNIPYNHQGWNAVASSILIPAKGSVSVYTKGNYDGECAGMTSTVAAWLYNFKNSLKGIKTTHDGNSPVIWNVPSSHNDNVQSIRLNSTCYRGRDYCWKHCKTTGQCDWCGVGHNCCRQKRGGGNNPCKYWDGNYFDHVCTRAHW